VTSHRPGIREGVLVRLAELQARANSLIEKDGRAPLLPKGIGQAIMEHFGIVAGPGVGEMKNRLEQAVLDGALPRDGRPEEYLAYLEQRPG
jgi:poly(A) polymerase